MKIIARVYMKVKWHSRLKGQEEACSGSWKPYFGGERGRGGREGKQRNCRRRLAEEEEIRMKKSVWTERQ